jgi:Ni,Fe-hydrogenase I large subunit
MNNYIESINEFSLDYTESLNELETAFPLKMNKVQKLRKVVYDMFKEFVVDYDKDISIVGVANGLDRIEFIDIGLSKEMLDRYAEANKINKLGVLTPLGLVKNRLSEYKLSPYNYSKTTNLLNYLLKVPPKNYTILTNFFILDNTPKVHRPGFKYKKKERFSYLYNKKKE